MDGSFSSINKSCLNNSSSKQLYSFSRAKRFKTSDISISRSQSIYNFYQLPSIFALNKKVGPLFTKDKKELVFPNQKQDKNKPGPYSYIYDVGSITESLRQKKGITMAARHISSARSLINSRNFTSPSPNSYQKITEKYISLKKHEPHYSFSKQIKQLRYPLKNRVEKDSPGAALYYIQMSKIEKVYAKLTSVKNTKIFKLKQMTKKNDIKTRLLSNAKNRSIQADKLYNSIQNRQKQLIGKNSSVRKTLKVENPQTLTKQTPDKVYISNRFKNSPRPIFTKSPRNIIKNSIDSSKLRNKYYTPGPGSYPQFSQFARIQKQKLQNKLKSKNIYSKKQTLVRNKYSSESHFKNSKYLQKIKSSK